MPWRLTLLVTLDKVQAKGEEKKWKSIRRALRERLGSQGGEIEALERRAPYTVQGAELAP